MGPVPPTGLPQPALIEEEAPSLIAMIDRLVRDLFFSEAKGKQVDGARRGEVGGRDWEERREGGKTRISQETIS